MKISEVAVKAGVELAAGDRITRHHVRLHVDLITAAIKANPEGCAVAVPLYLVDAIEEYCDSAGIPCMRLGIVSCAFDHPDFSLRGSTQASLSVAATYSALNKREKTRAKI